MTNITPQNILTGYNYNLSTLISDAAIEQPSNWFANFNELLDYFPATVFLAAFGIIVFVILKFKTQSSDSEALAYSGIVTTFIGVLMFVMSSVSGVKVLSWVQFVPFIILTAIFIFINMSNKNY